MYNIICICTGIYSDVNMYVKVYNVYMYICVVISCIITSRKELLLLCVKVPIFLVRLLPVGKSCSVSMCKYVHACIYWCCFSMTTMTTFSYSYMSSFSQFSYSTLTKIILGLLKGF